MLLAMHMYAVCVADEHLRHVRILYSGTSLKGLPELRESLNYKDTEFWSQQIHLNSYIVTFPHSTRTTFVLLTKKLRSVKETLHCRL